MSNKNKCIKLYDKIVTAFHNQSGGEWNDTMYYQWLGASQDMQEAEEEFALDDDWDGLLPTLTACWKYVECCKKIDDLQENMPDEIYG